MGILLAVVGVAVLAVAIIALHHPKKTSSNTAAGATTATSGAATSPETATSPHPSTAPSNSAQNSTSTAPAVSAGSSTDSSGPAGSASAIAAAQAVPLVVLNNTTITGLAAQAATRFEAGGWTVSSQGNLTNNIISTCAYYDPSVSGAKQAAMVLQAQYPTIKRVEPKFDGLPPGPVVVVLTPDYSAG